MRSVRGTGLHLALAAAVMTALLLGPSPARAGLVSVGDASLVVDSTTIFSGAATVGPGVEKSGTFVGALSQGTSTWNLNLTDLGFTLTGSCTVAPFECDFEEPPPPLVFTLTLSGLTFSPPEMLVGLQNISGGLASAASSPSVTPPSGPVSITFTSFSLGTHDAPLTQSYTAQFNLAPLTAVPVPAALSLVLAGGLALGLLSRRGRS